MDDHNYELFTSMESKDISLHENDISSTTSHKSREASPYLVRESPVDSYESPSESLPELIIEKEKKYSHDDPIEVYDKLHKTMNKLYKKYILEIDDDTSSVDSAVKRLAIEGDAHYEERNIERSVEEELEKPDRQENSMAWPEKEVERHVFCGVSRCPGLSPVPEERAGFSRSFSHGSQKGRETASRSYLHMTKEDDVEVSINGSSQGERRTSDGLAKTTDASKEIDVTATPEAMRRRRRSSKLTYVIPIKRAIYEDLHDFTPPAQALKMAFVETAKESVSFENTMGRDDAPISPNVDQDAPISPNVDQDAPISPNVYQDAPISPNVYQDAPISPNVDQDVPISPCEDREVSACFPITGRSNATLHHLTEALSPISKAREDFSRISLHEGQKGREIASFKNLTGREDVPIFPNEDQGTPVPTCEDQGVSPCFPIRKRAKPTPYHPTKGETLQEKRENVRFARHLNTESSVEEDHYIHVRKPLRTYTRDNIIRKKKEKTSNDDLRELLDTSNKCSEERADALERNEDRMFLLSLLSSFEKIPEHKKNAAKIKIISLIESFHTPHNVYTLSPIPEITEVFSRSSSRERRRRSKGGQEIAKSSSREGQGIARSSSREGQEIARSSSHESQEFARSSSRKVQEIARSSSREGQEIARSTSSEGQEIARSTSSEGQEIARSSSSGGQEIARSSSHESQEIARSSSSEGQGIARSSSREGQEIARSSSHESQEIARSSSRKVQEIARSSSSEGQEIARNISSEGQEIARSSSSGGQEIARSSSHESQEIARSSSSGGQEIARSSSSGGQEIARSSSSGDQEIARSSSSGDQEIARSSSSGAQEIARSSSREGQEIARSSSHESQEIARSSSRKVQEIARSSSREGQEIARSTSSEGQEIARSSSSGDQEIARSSSSGAQEIARRLSIRHREIASRSYSHVGERGEGVSVNGSTQNMGRTSESLAKTIDASKEADATTSTVAQTPEVMRRRRSLNITEIVRAKKTKYDDLHYSTSNTRGSRTAHEISIQYNPVEFTVDPPTQESRMADEESIQDDPFKFTADPVVPFFPYKSRPRYFPSSRSEGLDVPSSLNVGRDGSPCFPVVRPETSRPTAQVVTSSPRESPLPELIKEIDKVYVDDESEEFYENLERRMEKVYRKYILNEDIHSDDSDVQIYNAHIRGAFDSD